MLKNNVPVFRITVPILNIGMSNHFGERGEFKYKPTTAQVYTHILYIHMIYTFNLTFYRL